MKRRQALLCLAASTYSLDLSASIAGSPEVGKPKQNWNHGLRPLTARVIGVGNAGSHLLVQAWRSGQLPGPHCQVSFAVVTAREHTNAYVQVQSVLGCDAVGRSPIEIVSIGRPVFESRREHACWALRAHGPALRSLVQGVDVVCLVVGIGGCTGSAVAPLLARKAKSGGATVLVVVATPFQWEVRRYPDALDTVRALERHADSLVSLSNDQAGGRLGESATLEDVMALQGTEVTNVLDRLLSVATAVASWREQRA